MSLLLRCLIETAAALILGLVLRCFVCIFVQVKGTSMMDTMRNGEILLVRRYSRRRNPRRGDIVVCRFGTEKKLYLKRVIGLPGETVSTENDTVMIDGKILHEPYIARHCLRKTQPQSLGSDEYFMLGDNRPVSRDSRRLGAVSRKGILGYAVCVMLPLKVRRRIPPVEEYQTSEPDT